MSRSRLCRICRDFHDVATAWPAACAEHFGPPSNGAPYIVSDGMDAIENPANGLMYDSRSAYYRAVREAGGAIVEPGMVSKRPEMIGPPVAETMRRVIQQLQSR